MRSAHASARTSLSDPPAAEGEPAGPDTAEVCLEAVARGDEAAFARLYDLLAPQVYGMVRRVVRDPAQSEEVTQEVFLEVWRTAGRFRQERGSARALVLTMAHRRAVDRVRAAQATTEREHRVAVTNHDSALSEASDPVVDEVIDRLDRTRVQACLRALTPLQRESIMLAYYGGHTHTQVAALLGIPLGTVKTRLRDGLIRLRDCLGVTA